MNRRTVLRTAGVTATVGLSGCLEALQEHYQGSFRGLIPIEIHSDADRHFDVTLEAYEIGTDRKTYEESYTITANQTASPPHLDAIEQLLRVTKYRRKSDERTVREATVGKNTKLVNVRITNDDLLLNIEREEGAEERSPTGDPGTDGPATNESGRTEPGTNGSDATNGSEEY